MGTRPRRPKIEWGDRQLLLPRQVTIRRSGSVVSVPGIRASDALGRGGDGLFLAERFARVDLTRPRHLRMWILGNGAPAFASLAGSKLFEYSDPLTDIGREQEQIRWFLGALAQGTQGENFRHRLAPADRVWWVPPELRLPPHLIDYVDRRWAKATRAIAPRPLPWDRWLNILAVVAEPYVSAALSIKLFLVPEGNALTIGGSNPPATMRSLYSAFVLPFSWHSILCPIYLQLYEGLRRLSEGLPASRYCLECGRPFLVFDARRTRFCTASERNRYNQRRYRLRREQASRSLADPATPDHPLLERPNTRR